MTHPKSSGTSLAKSPVLWLLTATLTACGGGGAPAPGGSGANKLPEIVVRGEDGRALSAEAYLASGQTLTLNVSDLDGSVKKVSYVIDRGTPNERGGELAPAGKMTLSLPALEGGAHTLSVSATDNAGGVGSAQATFRVDAAAPTITGMTLNDKALAADTPINLDVDDAASVTVTANDTRGDSAGTPAPVTLRLLEGSQVRASGTGSVRADLSKKADGSARTAGAVTFTAEARDSVGYVTTRTFTLNFTAAKEGETTAPTFTWLTPSGGYVSGSTQVRARVIRNGTDLSSTVTYSVSCGSLSGETWTLGAGCADGSSQTITASVTDGGKTYTSIREVTVDAAAPTVQITSPTPSQSFTQAPVTIGVQAQDQGSGLKNVTVYAKAEGKAEEDLGSPSATGTLAWYPQTTDGTPYTLRAVATDQAGNSKTSALVSGVRIQTASQITSPLIAIERPAAAPQGQKVTREGRDYVRGFLDVQASANTTAQGGFRHAELLIDGEVAATETPGAGSTSLKPTFTFDFDRVNDGLHDVAVRFTDVLGTVSAPKVSVYVDRTAPVVSWNTPASGKVTNQPVVLQASASDAASGLNGTVTYSVEGQPVTSPWTPGSDGTYAVTASAADNVGNVGTQTTTLTYDATRPVITATSPADTQEFSTAPVTISATATDNLTGVTSMEATVQGPGDSAATTLGTQQGSSYSAVFTPVKAGAYTVTFKALDAAGNPASTVTRTFSYNVTTPPTEKAPAPVLDVVGNEPFSGNMSVNVSGNFDTGSQVDRMLLQITDANGVVDNTTYMTTQARATFSVDTTKFANGAVQLQVVAYTKSGLRGTSAVQTVQVQNLTSPELAVTAPADGATLTTPFVPVRVTLTKRSADYNKPQTIQVDILDYRGRVALQRTLTTSDTNACTGDAASLTCNTSFDMAGLPADTYTVRVRTAVEIVNPSGANIIRPLETNSRFTSNTDSVLPPAATIRFPAITDNRAPGRIDSVSGIVVNVSDNTGVVTVEGRIVGPFDATKPLALNGTAQCQESEPVAGREAVDILLLNYGLNPALQLGDVVLPSVDIDGSAYVPDNRPNERYDFRVTTIDSEGNRNIQCIPILIDRAGTARDRAANSAYTTRTSTTPTTPDPTPGELNYTSGTWELSGMNNRSRVAAVLYLNGTQQSVTFNGSVTGNTNVSVGFGNEGTYQIVWLVQDMTTGIVTSAPGGYINVKRNPK